MCWELYLWTTFAPNLATPFFSKFNPKSSKHQPTIHQQFHEKSILGASWVPRPFVLPFWWVLGAFYGPQEANMAATWVPRWRLNRIKINAKMRTRIRCVLDGHWKWFFQIWGGSKMKGSRVSETHCCQVWLKRVETPKIIIFQSMFHNLWIRMVQHWSEHVSKIDETMTSTWEGILASMFCICWWMLVVFVR